MQTKHVEIKPLKSTRKRAIKKGLISTFLLTCNVINSEARAHGSANRLCCITHQYSYLKIHQQYGSREMLIYCSVLICMYSCGCFTHKNRFMYGHLTSWIVLHCATLSCFMNLIFVWMCQSTRLQDRAPIPNWCIWLFWWWRIAIINFDALSELCIKHEANIKHQISNRLGGWGRARPSVRQLGTYSCL